MSTVSLDITANAQPALTAANTVVAGFQKLETQMQRVQKIQQGIADPDFGQKDLQRFNADYEEASKRLQALRQMRGRTADQLNSLAAVRGDQELTPSVLLQAARDRIEDPRERDAFLTNVGSRIFQGTQFAPPVPSGPPPAAPDGADQPGADAPAPAAKAAPAAALPEARSTTATPAGSGPGATPVPVMARAPADAAPPERQANGRFPAKPRSLDDLLAALKETGQAKTPFQDINWRRQALHPYRNELPEMQRRYETMRKTGEIGAGPVRALRKLGPDQDNVLGYMRHLPTLFGQDPKKAATKYREHADRVNPVLFEGMRLTPPAGPKPPPAPPAMPRAPDPAPADPGLAGTPAPHIGGKGSATAYTAWRAAQPAPVIRASAPPDLTPWKEQYGPPIPPGLMPRAPEQYGPPAPLGTAWAGGAVRPDGTKLPPPAPPPPPPPPPASANPAMSRDTGAARPFFDPGMMRGVKPAEVQGLQARATVELLERIRRLADEAGQSGKKFSELDWGHAKLAAVAEDAKQMAAQLDDLVDQGSTADAHRLRRIARKTNKPIDPFDLPEIAQHHYTGRGRDRFLAEVGSTMSAGTRFAVPPAPPPGDGGNGGGSGGGSGGAAAGGGGFFARAGSFGRGLMAGIGGGLGLGAVQMAGKIVGTVGTGLEQSQQDAMATNRLGKSLQDTGASFDVLQRSVRQTAEGLSLTYDAAQKLALEWSRLTNDRSADKALMGVRDAGAFARGYGLDEQQTNRTFARASHVGVNARELATLVAETAKAAGVTGQTGELAQLLTEIKQGLSQSFNNNPAALEQAAKLFAGMSQDGKRDGGPQGLDNADIFQRADTAMRQGGAHGMASQVLDMRVQQAEGVQDVYEMRRFREKGALAVLPSGRTRLEATDEFLQAETRGLGREQRSDIYANHFGLTMDEGDRLRAGVDRIRDRGGFGAFNRSMRDAGLDPEKVKLENLAALEDIRAEDRPALDERRTRLAARTDLSDQQRRDLQLGKAGAPVPAFQGDDKALRDQMLRVTNEAGAEPNKGQKTQDLVAQMSNAITRLGDPLVDPANKLKEAGIALVDGAGRLAKAAETFIAANASPARALREGVERGREGRDRLDREGAPSPELRQERATQQHLRRGGLPNAQRIPDEEWNSPEAPTSSPPATPATALTAPRPPAGSAPAPQRPPAPARGGLADRARERTAAAASPPAAATLPRRPVEQVEETTEPPAPEDRGEEPLPLPEPAVAAPEPLPDNPAIPRATEGRDQAPAVIDRREAPPPGPELGERLPAVPAQSPRPAPDRAEREPDTEPAPLPSPPAPGAPPPLPASPQAEPAPYADRQTVPLRLRARETQAPATIVAPQQGGVRGLLQRFGWQPRQDAAPAAPAAAPPPPAGTASTGPGLEAAHTPSPAALAGPVPEPAPVPSPAAAAASAGPPPTTPARTAPVDPGLARALGGPRADHVRAHTGDAAGPSVPEAPSVEERPEERPEEPLPPPTPTAAPAAPSGPVRLMSGGAERATRGGVTFRPGFRGASIPHMERGPSPDLRATALTVPAQTPAAPAAQIAPDTDAPAPPQALGMAPATEGRPPIVPVMAVGGGVAAGRAAPAAAASGGASPPAPEGEMKPVGEAFAEYKRNLEHPVIGRGTPDEHRLGDREDEAPSAMVRTRSPPQLIGLAGPRKPTVGNRESRAQDRDARASGGMRDGRTGRAAPAETRGGYIAPAAQHGPDLSKQGEGQDPNVPQPPVALAAPAAAPAPPAPEMPRPAAAAPSGEISRGGAQLSDTQRAVAAEGTSDRALMDLIGKAEGTDRKGPDGKRMPGTGYNTTYNHGAYNPVEKGGRNADLTAMTIAEVREFQKGMLANQRDSSNIKSSAAGRYQMMGYTLDDAMRKGVIKSDDRFDAATQDRLAKWKIDEARRGATSEGQILNRLAGTWASLPKADGSAPYAGQRTHVQTEDVRAAVQARPPSPADTPNSAATALRIPPANATAEAAASIKPPEPRQVPEVQTMPKAPEVAPATDPVMATVQAVDSTPNYDQFPKPPKQDFEPTQTRGAVGGTPLPADERQRGLKVPGSPNQQNVALQANLNIAPIRVEHTNGGTGEVIGTEYYPVTKVDSARALQTVA